MDNKNNLDKILQDKDNEIKQLCKIISDSSSKEEIMQSYAPKLNQLSTLLNLGTAGRFTIPKPKSEQKVVSEIKKSVDFNKTICVIAHCNIDALRKSYLIKAINSLFSKNSFVFFTLDLNGCKTEFDKSFAAEIHPKYIHWSPQASLIVLDYLQRLTEKLIVFSHPYFCALVKDWKINCQTDDTLQIDSPYNLVISFERMFFK